MTRLLVLLAVLWPLAAGAQMFDDEEGGVPTTAPRSIPLNTSGNVAATIAAIGVTPTACWKFDEAVGATLAANCGGSSTLTVNDAPTLVDTALHPTGLASLGKAWSFDGSNDYLSCTDAACGEWADPASSFSFLVIFTTNEAYSLDILVGKTGAAYTAFGWSVHQSSTSNLQFSVSKDGVFSTRSSSGSLPYSVGRPVCAGGSYQYTSDGNSVINFVTDSSAATANTTAQGPVYNTAGTFSIGSASGSTYFSKVQLHLVAVYNGTVVSNAALQKACATWQGRMGWGGNAVSVASAAPPAIPMAAPDSGIYPFLVNQPANSSYIGSPASGSGGLYAASAITNLAQRSSFETWAGASPDDAPTGWTEARTSSGDCAVSTAQPAHLSSNARCTTTDADDAVTLTGACLTVTGGHLCTLSGYAKTVSGTGLLDINIIEDDSADCGSPTGTTSVINDWVPGATYTRGSGTITLGGGTARVQVQVALPAAAAQVLDIDAIQLRCQATTAPLEEDAYCAADTDATATCNTMVASIASPISWIGLASLIATQRSPWAGTDPAADLMLWAHGVPGAGNDKWNAYIESTTDEPGSTIRDSAGGVLSVEQNVANWAAATDYALKFRLNNAGAMGNYWNAAWNTTTAGAGTGIRAATQTTLYIGGSNTAGSGVWSRDLTVYRKLLP